ncbi:hypothetical protein K491DRAFT_718216 [Lophiostoma macrostomum CBS 122681]|uniref:Uncharacterized protein n=1 Tax=Lophiostoma macrostomum CBS 122681 TaxID=1314788 RepID=A0A6A6T425_9PLEO|nr:hypothetical protein K491DRAFT_718216 [Lophiostoma macrostomum CBS 122681]
MPVDSSKYRADNTDCLISGVQGAQNMRVGIAYFYRGHYIYSLARTPLEPQPFATKGRLMVAGTAVNTAPFYDNQGPDLVPEPTIGFLYKAQMTDQHYGLDGTRSASQHVATPIIIEPDTTARAHDTAFSSYPGPANRKHFTPHDRAHFLAASLPGSKFVSRANSPSRDYDDYKEQEHEDTSRLRPVLSSTRLGSLLAGGGVALGEGSGAKTPPATEWMDDEAISSYMYKSPSPEAPAHVSRPRRASVLLNQAYNATHPSRNVLKCPLHDGACDGVSVVEPHLTEQCRLGRGFKDLYPVLQKGDRTMIDWEKVMAEEKAKMNH